MNIGTIPHGNAAARVLHAGRGNSITADRQSVGCHSAQAQAPARARLMMVWRTHPESRRLECRWVTERGTATDEGVSCNDLLRQAA